METINYVILGKLNKEWKEFLTTIPSNTGISVTESNRIFASRRNIWIRKMLKKYRVTRQQLQDNFVHNK